MPQKQAIISDVTGSGIDVWFEAATITHTIKRSIIEYSSRIAYSSFLNYDAAGLIRVNLTGVINEDILESRKKLLYLTNLKTKILLCDFGSGLAYYGTISQLKIKTLTMGQLLVEMEFYTAGNIGTVFEAEDLSGTGSVYYDPTLFSNDYAVRLTSSGQNRYYNYYQNEYQLPQGNYVVIARIKCSAVIANEVRVYFYNYTDYTTVKNQYFSSVVGMYYYVTSEFEIDSADVGDNLRLSIYKTYSTANNYDFDFVALLNVEYSL